VSSNREWVKWAINEIEADFQRSADTHLIKVEVPGFPGIDLYFKDESTHPTGSLKHRLARSLFLYGLCNGWINEGTPIIESSSGSTAISEAYFARLLGLPFIAVVPEQTSAEKIAQIEFHGGECRLVPGSEIYSASEKLAAELNGHYMDQFTYAERATDWRGNNNIADSMFRQLARERYPDPEWIVVGAGTGGTSATIGRYLRYHQAGPRATRLAIADPEGSVFYDAFAGNPLPKGGSSAIEGIGRPRVEPSFVSSVIDRVARVPDSGSMAALLLLEQVLGRKVGGSTGTNMILVLELMHRMKQAGQQGSIVTLICDSGERYLDRYYSAEWRSENGYETEQWLKSLMNAWFNGQWNPPQKLNIADH